MIYQLSSNYKPNFSANLSSPKLRFKQEDFFIKIQGYGRNTLWASKMKETTDCAVNLMRNNTLVETILMLISNGVSQANKMTLNIGKRTQTGVLRTLRPNWKSFSENRDVVTSYVVSRYKGYANRLDVIEQHPLNSINSQIGMSRPNKYQDIIHGSAFKINGSLDYIFKLYNDRFLKYLKKDVQPNDLADIVDIVAEIRWVLAHSTPWMRGSDAISNAFMRAMFKSVGVKAYPPAKNISFDLEAYCRNLGDYKKNFSTFFEKPLMVIE